jgi:selenocysteine lyase/cysteine desulfurase
MIYLDNGATSLHKPPSVHRAVQDALLHCANPGRGGHAAAMRAAERVYECRENAAALFSCRPEQVVLTFNCTHGLNMAIRTLVKPGDRVLISGFEHNAVTRMLHALGAQLIVAGRRLFDQQDTLEEFEKALRTGPKAAVFTHVSNVFGYILPVEQLSRLCRQYGVPFIIDGAQSAGSIGINLEQLGADFIAMPGHKGLLGPQGTGLLLCGRLPEPLLYGGTGSDSILREMPEYLPDRVEAGTLNVPGIAGLSAGLAYLRRVGVEAIGRREAHQAKLAAEGLRRLGVEVFSGPNQTGTVSFVPGMDCEEMAQKLARRDIAVRAGLHCAPLAHESAGTLKTGTVRVSFGHDIEPWQTQRFLKEMAALL